MSTGFDSLEAEGRMRIRRGSDNDDLGFGLIEVGSVAGAEAANDKSDSGR